MVFLSLNGKTASAENSGEIIAIERIITNVQSCKFNRINMNQFLPLAIKANIKLYLGPINNTIILNRVNSGNEYSYLNEFKQ